MEQIIIGDIMQGVSVLDVKEINSGNQTKVSLLEGPSSPYWVILLYLNEISSQLMNFKKQNLMLLLK